MTIAHRQRVADVVAIIGRERARVADIERAIQRMEMRRYQVWRKPSTKKEKLVARSVIRAFERFERTLNRLDVSTTVLKRAFPEEDNEFDEWRSRLRHWQERVQVFAQWPLGHPEPSADHFVRKRKAVAVAAALLARHGLPLTVTPKRSIFCRVAAVLYGERADLSHQCRAYKARNRVSI